MDIKLGWFQSLSGESNKDGYEYLAFKSVNCKFGRVEPMVGGMPSRML